MNQIFTLIGSVLLGIIVFIAVVSILAFVFTKLEIDNIWAFVCVGVVSVIVILWILL